MTKGMMMMLEKHEISEMERLKAYFPFRRIAGVKLPDGTFETFACTTFAKARNFARKHGGQCFELHAA